MALRATVHGRVQGVGFREATRRRARELGLRGWVANTDRGTVRLHAEGPEEQLERLTEFLQKGPPDAKVDRLETISVPDEGHEKFAIRKR